ncbi:MAG: RecQ family ATP-dependent DNA helicase [Haliscomenobacter sp.]|nr:RecQ family ATP-dependent DNA helicase [Haliscomenobacter sp.]
MTQRPIDILRQYWGYDQFRPLQEDIIQSVLDGKDTLALLPTGGGKSLCFQVPALCMPGVCIVVSPLIALMKDQVFQLQKRNIPAAAIYSGMPYREIDRIFDNAVYGGLRLLYLSPERLTTELAKERIRRMPVNLLAVDEAHCISQWGYDFRPPYLEIARIREWMPKVPALALTATATPEVVEDIQEKLEFQKKNVFQKSFARENLAYVVRHTEGKEAQLADILSKVPGSGVVYVRNRRRTKETADYLKHLGISADYYHAGLTHEQRSAKQDAWIQNRTRIIVSTNAFGMGIDKPDVRTVVHLELPDSLEAYFQEAGRAGRDGRKAFAVLLYNDNDRRQLEKQYQQAFPELAEIRRVYQAIGSFLQLATGAGKGESYDFDLSAFAQAYQFDPVAAFHALKVLEQEGWIALTEAVVQPSTVQILVDKDQLYDYQLRHPELDKILKVLLRTYQGAFSGPIHLQEKRLAGFLKIPLDALRQGLVRMHQENILEYLPQKEKPQLVFLKERVDVRQLGIDHQRYGFLRNRHLERIRQAVGYAQDSDCRSRFLLAYFGEKEAPACGACDLCLERKKTGLTEEGFARYRQKIRLVLRHEPLSAREILDAFAPKAQDDVLRTLEYLLQEGIVVEKDQRIAWVGP